jgi:hypothetical protein
MRLSAPAETRQIAGSYVFRTSTISPGRVPCTAIGTGIRLLRNQCSAPSGS